MICFVFINSRVRLILKLYLRCNLGFHQETQVALVSRRTLTDIQAVFISWKLVSRKLLSKFFCVCLSLEKLVNEKHFPVSEKHFPVKEKFDLVFRKVFYFYFGRKTLSGSCEKFRNVMLFVDYIKFDP